MEYINTGLKNNDKTADSIREGANKINSNFDLIYKTLRMDNTFRFIEWKGIEDFRKMAEDVNYNFKQIEKQLNI